VFFFGLKMSSESQPLVSPPPPLPSTLPWTLADEEALTKRENAITLSLEPKKSILIDIVWPIAYPILSEYIEKSLLSIVLPGNKRDWKHFSYPLHVCDISSEQLTQIYTICVKNNIDLAQAMSIRSNFLHSAVPYRFTVTYAQEEAAMAFERIVENYLRSKGVNFKTQDDQKRIFYESGGSGNIGPTPDFLINEDCILHINGKRVKYIEVKRFYGVGYITGLKEWRPCVKITEQAIKYIKAFGPNGAFIIEHGFGEAFKKRLPECLLLLDAAPFLEDVEACNQNEIQRQVKLGIIPFGKTGNPRKDIHADNIWNANYQRRIALRERNININI
jgi:hypothetical protein